MGIRKLFFALTVTIAVVVAVPIYSKASVLPKNFYAYDAYFEEAEKYFGVPFLLLKAIALSENGRFDPNAIRKNGNGTKDYGLMQINTIWLRKFNLTEKEILNPRVNIYVAAKILRSLIDEGYTWEIVGKYHSKTKKYKKAWLSRVKKNLVWIIKYDKKYRYKIESDG